MSSNFCVGILGDGQLARMMCQEGHKLNIHTTVLSTSDTSPACLVNSDNLVVQDISEKAILNLAQHCLSKDPSAVLTIESEFINPDYLENVQKQTGIKIFPSVKTLRQLRDRKPQKDFFIEHNLPTSAFYNIKNENELAAHLKQRPLVLKQRLFGYDGYGTLILNNVHDLEKIYSHGQSTTRDFKWEDWIYEDFIKFKRELAISFSRNSQGQICTFPWVETFQQNSKCLWVKGPIALSSEMKELQVKLAQALDQIDYVGFITFEIFETSESKLLINEVAPRVHNSAHYSLEALYLNQFKVHLLSVLNLDIPKSPKVISPFSMYNLIASKNESNPAIPISSNHYFLNWYQKKDSRKGRKMGHMTCLASTFDEALATLEENFKEFDL